MNGKLPFNEQLSTLEWKIYDELVARLRQSGRNRFSSDDIRIMGLDRFFTDKQHEMGTFCAKLKHKRLIKEVDKVRSVIPSNHNREIREYQVRGLNAKASTGILGYCESEAT